MLHALLVAPALVCLSGAQAPADAFPDAPPPKMPLRLLADFEKGRSGDVFAMIRANHWNQGLEEVEVFPKALIREKLEAMVQQGDPKAMLALADRLPWDLADPQKNKPLEARQRKLIEQAASMNEPTAMGRYANALWRHDHNKEAAINWWVKGKRLLEERAKQGDPESIVALAWYGSIPDANGDPGLARRLDPHQDWLGWLRKAAEFDAASALQYGSFCNEKEKTYWVEKAANQGDWIAMVEMGRYHAFGFPSPGPGQVILDPKKWDAARPKTDPAKAWQWWDKAAALVGWDAVSERLPEELPKRPE